MMYALIIRCMLQLYVTPFHLHSRKMMQRFPPPFETSRPLLVDLIMSWLAIDTMDLPLECPTSNHDTIPNNIQIMLRKLGAR
mmetsp:Transcript_13446/g.24703  ORF Transcript_13446/g.24703 Transcript_13446/m.24703 type:complete len:82 (-) Transcript_13446:694-939(-)